MAPEESFLQRIGALSGSVPIAVTLVSLVLSGSYFFGFLTVVGFEYLGAIGLSDFSKSALRWSPVILSLALGGLISSIFKFPGQERLEGIQKKLEKSKPEDQESLIKINKEIDELSEYYKKLFFFLKTLNNRIIFITLLFSIIIMTIFFSMYVPIKNIGIVIITGYSLLGIPLFYEASKYSFYKHSIIISLYILFFLVISAFITGTALAIRLVSPSDDQKITISLQDGDKIFASQIRFDYVTFAVDASGSMTLFENSKIEFVSKPHVCISSIIECRN